MKFPFKRLLSAIGVVTLLSIVGASPTHAATAGAGLEISPALVQLNATPGETYKINLTVKNVTSNALDFTSTVSDFGAKGETGEPNVILDPAVTLPTSIKSWVAGLPDFSLAPGQTKALTAAITIPGNAEPGGHYGVLRFTGTLSGSSNSGVAQIASAGTLVLIRAAGDAKEQLNLITYEASVNNNPSAFFENGPITLVSRFQNTGNVHVVPTGHIDVTDTFGNPVETLTINGDNGNVLPSSIRRFESTFGDKKFLFGRYTANINIAYGTTGGAIVRSISFWVIPWKLVLIGLLALATIIYILRGLIRRYNRHIIRNAHRYAPKTKHKK